MLSFILIAWVVSTSNALHMPEPKFCFKCKHFRPDDLDLKYSRCGKFPKHIEPHIEYLVTGIHENKYSFCTVVRKSQDMCGEEAKAYEDKSPEDEKRDFNRLLEAEWNRLP